MNAMQIHKRNENFHKLNWGKKKRHKVDREMKKKSACKEECRGLNNFPKRTQSLI